MKVTLTFEYLCKRYNIVVPNIDLPTKGDAFNITLKIGDAFEKTVNNIPLTLVVRNADINLYNLKMSGRYVDCTDYTADVQETVVHCDVIPIHL